mmetsp:Transcript_56594/g.175982  ORF Transcript_56594/g.175982 Transcript_56594/m.175982 type:complete len:370 (+) Transcript_56594:895-2004(+)
MRSSRPGRKSERSRRSGRFVAPTRKTVAGMASSSVTSCETTRSMTPPESLPRPRAGARESSSSKNKTQGCRSRALWKRFRTFRSLSPMYMERSSGPFTLRKCTRHSVATAFANRVLPVPGGPNNRTPLRTFWPANSFPCASGKVMQFITSSLASCSPPTSAQRTLEDRVTATFVPPWTRLTACSILSASTGAASSPLDPRCLHMTTSLQTERMSVRDRPAVSFATESAGVSSALILALPCWRLSAGPSCATAAALEASSGRGIATSSWKARRSGAPTSSASSQLAASNASGRELQPAPGASAVVAEAAAPAAGAAPGPPRAPPVRTASKRRRNSSSAAGEGAGPATARAWSRRRHRSAGELSVARRRSR